MTFPVEMNCLTSRNLCKPFMHIKKTDMHMYTLIYKEVEKYLKACISDH